jgi:putative SOS response-associated peptidase YedK
MCGKFTFMATWAEVVDFSQPLIAKPSNAPEQAATPMRWAPVLHLDKAGKRTMTSMRWAFSEFNEVRGYDQPAYIHARDDKVLTSKVWRPHFEDRRGLLIVTSFYEAELVPTYKPDRVTPTGNFKDRPWVIKTRDGSKLAIAVIFRETETPSGRILEFVQVTAKANKGMSEFVAPDPDREHSDKRMPAIIPEADIPKWLGEAPATPEEVRDLLRTYEDDGAWDMRPEEPKRAPPKPKAPKKSEPELF